MTVLDKLVETYMIDPGGLGKAKKLIQIYGAHRLFECENFEIRRLARGSLEDFATDERRNHVLDCLDEIIHDPDIRNTQPINVRKAAVVLGNLKESKHFSLICDVVSKIRYVREKGMFARFVSDANTNTSPRFLEIARDMGWKRSELPQIKRGYLSRLIGMTLLGTVAKLNVFNQYPRQADVVDIFWKFNLNFSTSIGFLLLDECKNPNFGYVLDYLKETSLTLPAVNTLRAILKAPVYRSYAEQNTKVLDRYLVKIYDGLDSDVKDSLTMGDMNMLVKAYGLVVPRGLEIRYRNAAQDEFVSMLNKKLSEGDTLNQKKIILREWSRNVCAYIQRHPDALLLEVGA